MVANHTQAGEALLHVCVLQKLRKCEYSVLNLLLEQAQGHYLLSGVRQLESSHFIVDNLSLHLCAPAIHWKHHKDARHATVSHHGDCLPAGYNQEA